MPSENHLNFKDARGRQRSFDQRGESLLQMCSSMITAFLSPTAATASNIPGRHTAETAVAADIMQGFRQFIQQSSLPALQVSYAGVRFSRGRLKTLGAQAEVSTCRHREAKSRRKLHMGQHTLLAAFSGPYLP